MNKEWCSAGEMYNKQSWKQPNFIYKSQNLVRIKAPGLHRGAASISQPLHPLFLQQSTAEDVGLSSEIVEAGKHH